MSKTPASGSSSYCSPAEALERYDWRVPADYLSDDGTRLTRGGVLASAAFADLLQEASGEVEAAATAGQRYVIDLAAGVNDLAALTGNSAQLLKGMVASLALGLLLDRRTDPRRPVPQRVQQARAMLEALRTGIAVFGLLETQQAGLPSHETESASQVEHRNMTTFELSRFFGRRRNRIDRP